MQKLLVYLPLIASGVAAAVIPMFVHKQDTFPVSIEVDAGKSLGPVKPVWRFFGADEPNYATMPNGEKLIAELGSLRRGEVYFRTHNLMNTGDGKASLKWGSTNLYTEDSAGNGVYDFKIVDHIFDTYLKQGIRPYVEIGFMPEALSTHPEPYRHSWTPKDPYSAIFTGWSYPPKSYAKWGDVVYHLARHCVEKYGRKEVERWYWEVWNEPNGYLQGSLADFLQLHDVAVAAVRRALPTARVGGPDTAGAGRYFSESLSHFAEGTPTDFVSFHAKGAPQFVDGHVRMGLSNQLRTMDDGFARVAANPSLKDRPIVIGESDPDGCAACQGPQLGYRNGPLYASYTAATIPRALELAKARDVNLEGVLTWAFEFEGYDSFAGFRQLATNGVDLPILNLFRMLSKMDGQQIAATSDGQVPLSSVLRDGVRKSADVGVWATREGDQVAVLVWHYHDDDIPGPSADVRLTVNGLPQSTAAWRVRQFRIDSDHSNAYGTWLKMGSPPRPDAAQTKVLQRAARLAQMPGPSDLNSDGGRVSLSMRLPRQSVALIVLSPE